MTATQSRGETKTMPSQRRNSCKTSRDGDDDDQHNAAAQKNSRQRASMACVHCRRRKIRCDGQTRPCATCARLGKACDYEPITEEENLIAREKKRASKSKRTDVADGIYSGKGGTAPISIPSASTSACTSYPQWSSSPTLRGLERSSSLSYCSVEAPGSESLPASLRHRKTSSIGSAAGRLRKRSGGSIASPGRISTANGVLTADRGQQTSPCNQAHPVSWINPFLSTSTSYSAMSASPLESRAQRAEVAPRYDTTVHAAGLSATVASPETSQSLTTDTLSPGTPSDEGVRSEAGNATLALMGDTSMLGRDLWDWSQSFGLAGGAGNMAVGTNALGTVNSDALASSANTNLPLSPLSGVSRSAEGSATGVPYLAQGRGGDPTSVASSSATAFTNWLQSTTPSIGGEIFTPSRAQANGRLDPTASTLSFDLASSLLVNGPVRSHVGGVESERGSTSASSFHSGMRSQLSSFSSSLPTNASTETSARSSLDMSPPYVFPQEPSSLSPRLLQRASGSHRSTPPAGVSAPWSSGLATLENTKILEPYESGEASGWHMQQGQGEVSLPFHESLTAQSRRGDGKPFTTQAVADDSLFGDRGFTMTSLAGPASSLQQDDLMVGPSLQTPLSSPIHLHHQHRGGYDIGARIGQMLTASQDRQRQQRQQQQREQLALCENQRHQTSAPSNPASSPPWNHEAFWAVPTMQSATAMTLRGAEAAAESSSPNDMLSLKSSADLTLSKSTEYCPSRIFHHLLSREEAIRTPPVLQVPQGHAD